ncbi:MAG: hypothetical protein ACRDJE_18445 [Dehalococcoidia bacterium]
MLARVSLSAVLAVAFVLATAGTVGAQRTPLRSVDWDAVIRSEPRISLPPDCLLLPFAPGPCIEVQADTSALPSGLPGFEEVIGYGPVTIAGYADTFPEDIVYGDLDGDGAEEAVIRVESGGTAGTIGFLIFREGVDRPELVTAVDGYKVYPQIENGRLVVRQPYYFGFEGNCCPTGAVQLYFVLDGKELRFVEVPGESPLWLILSQDGERPVTLAELVVTGFYRAIDDGWFEEAYGFLSPAYQAANPFPVWETGFATTRDVQVYTLPGASFTENGLQAQEVHVTLTVKDELPDGTLVTRRFAGTWIVVEGDRPGVSLWLDRATIELVR